MHLDRLFNLQWCVVESLYRVRLIPSINLELIAKSIERPKLTLKNCKARSINIAPVEFHLYF